MDFVRLIADAVAVTIEAFVLIPVVLAPVIVAGTGGGGDGNVLQVLLEAVALACLSCPF